ncbi:AraC family transcriptional regulator [Salipaludibacillus sp. CF4.18]|uniref:AraC family transcriptional regulator n=1 Tax=Salipaludibacillus sp. CF4.18 TaxID=3373081 RepID=UPI003EE4C168
MRRQPFKSAVTTFSELNQTYFRVHRIEKNIRHPEWKIDRVDRPYTVFWYVVSGEKTIKVDDKTYNVHQRDLVIFPSQVPFEIMNSSNDNAMEHFEVALEVRFGPFDLMSLYKFPIVMKLVDSEKVEKLITLWEHLYNNWSPSKRNPFSPANGEFNFGLNQTIDLLGYNALTLQWFAEILTIIRPYTKEISPTLDSRFQHLFYFIDKNLSKKLTLKTLANEVYISESHLSLLFRESLKMSPMEYVRKVRIQKARELLLSSSLPLIDVAEQIGYNDQSQLSRAFRQAVGVNPLEYRRKGDFI